MSRTATAEGPMRAVPMQGGGMHGVCSSVLPERTCTSMSGSSSIWSLPPVMHFRMEALISLKRLCSKSCCARAATSVQPLPVPTSQSQQDTPSALCD